jgi:Methyltransferase domain
MNIFWDEIIEPIFFEENVKSIVEIGSEAAINTTRILEYCAKSNARLISIDPAPLFEAEKYEKEHELLQIIQDISLNALPYIGDYDAVLIDGDHNWYTVYHELKLIEKNALQQGKFPIVFLHDTDWPYGRRDMYYFPDTIPEQFRKEYAKKGMLQGQSELIEPDSKFDKESINKSLNNALYEGGEKNGVLTAIEDFLSQSSLPLNFYNNTANHGLGIICNKNERLERFIEDKEGFTKIK